MLEPEVLRRSMQLPPHRAWFAMLLDINGRACVVEDALEPSLDAHIESRNEAAWANVPSLAKLAAVALLEADRCLGFIQDGQRLVGEWLMRGRV